MSSQKNGCRGHGTRDTKKKRKTIQELTAFNWFITVCGSLTPFKKNYVFVDDSKLTFFRQNERILIKQNTLRATVLIYSFFL